MANFFSFDREVMSVEPFDTELTDGYDEYEWPAGYLTTEGEVVPHDSTRMKLVTVMISPGIIVKCPVDVEAMGIVEDQKINVIMAGKKIACLAHKEDKRYVFFNTPLRKRYLMPRVIGGINAAIISVVAGYFLALVFSHQQSSFIRVAVEGASFVVFIGALIYSAYYFTNDKVAHQKMRQYMKKILK